MKQSLRIPLLILGTPLFLAIIAFLVVLYAIGCAVEILVAALENRKPQLPPASHADGTPCTWKEVFRG